MEFFMSEITKVEKPEQKQNIVDTVVQKISSSQGISFMNTPSMQMKKSEHDRIFNSPVIQNKNNINTPAFKFVDNRPETIVQRRLQEIINNSSSKIVQREDDKDTVQGKFEVGQRKEQDEKEKILQGKFEIVQKKEEDEDKYKNAVQKKSNETGLPDNLKSGVENLSGISMDNVRVHYNSDKPAQLNALAYTQGTDIHVAPNQEKHLPHEAWHVVQQAQGRVAPTMQMKGVGVNDERVLEKEADDMSGKALQMQKGVQNIKHQQFNQPIVQLVGNQQQTGNNTCWAASGYAVHLNAGRKAYKSHKNFVKYKGSKNAKTCFKNDEKCDIDEIIGGQSNNNKILTGSDNNSPFDVKNFPANWGTNPMVANITVPGGHHYIVLDGYDNATLKFNCMDPALNKHEERSVDVKKKKYTEIGGKTINAVYFTD
jgi:hypothetical protein